MNARARAEALDRPPPATVRAYREVYGTRSARLAARVSLWIASHLTESLTGWKARRWSSDKLR